MKVELERLYEWVEEFGKPPKDATHICTNGVLERADLKKGTLVNAFLWGVGGWEESAFEDYCDLELFDGNKRLPPQELTQHLVQWFLRYGRPPADATHLLLKGPLVRWDMLKVSDTDVSLWDGGPWCISGLKLDTLTHKAKVLILCDEPHDTLKTPPEQKETSMTAQDRLNVWVSIYGEVPPDATHFWLDGEFDATGVRKVEGGVVYYWSHYYKGRGKWARSNWPAEYIEGRKDEFVALENGKIKPPKKEKPTLSHAELRRRAWVERYGEIPSGATHLFLRGGLSASNMLKFEDCEVFYYNKLTKKWGIPSPVKPNFLFDKDLYLNLADVMEGNTKLPDTIAQSHEVEGFVNEPPLEPKTPQYISTINSTPPKVFPFAAMGDQHFPCHLGGVFGGG